MRMQVCAIELAFGLVVLVLFTGCGQQEPGWQGVAAEKQEVHSDTVIDTLAGAMASAPAKLTAANKWAPAAVEEQVVERVLAVNERTRKSISERFAMVQDPAVQKRIENGDQYSKVSIKRSGHAEKNAYEKARVSGENRTAVP